VIQLAMVCVVIAFPQIVMHYKGGAVKVDPGAIELQIPTPDIPPPPELQPASK
jgi:hypothetical protein